MHDGTDWLRQRLLVEIYLVSIFAVNEITINIYSDHELSPEATIRKFLIVRTEGSRRVERLIDFYSQEKILAVSYRVCSHRDCSSADWPL